MTTAQHPDPDHSDDRIFTAPDLVIMLDGASAFINTDVTTAIYVDHLGSTLRDAITHAPSASLVDALGAAIEQTADDLQLEAGAAPSSTVAVAHTRPGSIDLLVLGDTQIVTSGHVLSDDRINRIATAQRTAYQARLRGGCGYDTHHRVLLKELQEEERRHRNRANGYWIAEADPAAAAHALVEHLDRNDTPWLVLATDGAYRPMSHLGIDDWRQITDLDQRELADLLNRCHRWESKMDPSGAALPRAKRHDDKSLAVVQLRDE